MKKFIILIAVSSYSFAQKPPQPCYEHIAQAVRGYVKMFYEGKQSNFELRDQIDGEIQKAATCPEVTNAKSVPATIDWRRRVCGNGWCRIQGELVTGKLKAVNTKGNVYLHTIASIEATEKMLQQEIEALLQSIREDATTTLSDSYAKNAADMLIPKIKEAAEWKKTKEVLQKQGIQEDVLFLSKQRVIDDNLPVLDASSLKINPLVQIG